MKKKKIPNKCPHIANKKNWKKKIHFVFCSGAAPPTRSTSTQSSHVNPSSTTTDQSNDASWLGRMFNSGQANNNNTLEQAKKTDAGSFKPIQQDFNVPSDGSPAKHHRFRKSGRTIR